MIVDDEIIPIMIQVSNNRRTAVVRTDKYEVEAVGKNNLLFQFWNKYRGNEFDAYTMPARFIVISGNTHSFLESVYIFDEPNKIIRFVKQG
jgi:hypothetical protein